MRRSFFLCFSLAVSVFAARVYSGQLVHREFAQPISQDQAFSLRLNVDTGVILVQPSDSGQLVLSVDYDSSVVSYRHDVDPDMRRFRVNLNVRSWLRQQGKAGKEHLAFLNVRVPTNAPFGLTVRSKASETELRLGGLRLEWLKLDILAGETLLDFSKPNPELLHRLKIKHKIGDLTVRHLLNANFESAQIDGGVGEIDVDLSGDRKLVQSSVLELHLGVGSTTLHVPPDLPVRFEISKKLVSSVEVDGHFRQIRGGYESAAYSETRPGLLVRVKAGVGSLDILAE